MAEEDDQVTAADWSAIAEWVVAASILGGLISWLWRQRQTAADWFNRRWRRKIVTVLDHEVTAGAAWESVSQTPEVSMEAGVAYARTAARSGHPPYTVTRGHVSADQPLSYLLAKTAETVWEAVSSAQSELEPYLIPVRNYLTALIGKTGVNPARDFALGVLTERVRQEEDGWPDQPGDPRGRRTAHGTGASHLCLLERKHQVEEAIYRLQEPLARNS
jgi:hypothetical protein